MEIDLAILELYLKYGGELLWVDDSTRFPRPEGTTEQTDDMFITLLRTEDILAQLATGYYSDKLTQEMLVQLQYLEPKMKEEVFSKLLNIHGLTKETLYNRR